MAIKDMLQRFPRRRLLNSETPVERLDRMSDLLSLDLWLKRDDLTGLGLGGNKTRQLEFYFGEALAQGADTVLITGAVQSNFVRSAAAAAARLGLEAVLQLEQRVPDMGALYHSSGNVLLGKILGAEHISYPMGEDEAGADHALHQRAETLRAEGRRPYVIHLGIDHPPLGALGYVLGGEELNRQISDFDVAVVPSGSGATHAGLLTGLRLVGQTAPVYGICVRRDQEQQSARLKTVLKKLADMMGFGPSLTLNDILTWDGALAPGYGIIGDTTREALTLMARTEGVFLDPVYTAKTFAGLLGLLKEGRIQPGQKVVMLHTGGLPALFGYQTELEGPGRV
ncbi:D-cysteine desulfhydrase family protein [Parasedimentitalea psychrophila]|uniref:D-cysteine desulfhydrase family protein n=1 Tax=Parasedimentitalea psychrophila TaxID=2997337 RepID=A0A9Y2P2K6_9RHOB|nr:D-cysteine desulfhydrase family protein [Parasedimentitalea psychrophila]WIY25172.1 D-cysteine desulfhydrase family protein [Parasedimentitalea psychrophila]